MAPTPYSPEKRAQNKRKIDKEARRAADRLGAKHVAIIAFFADGEYMHMQDGGSAPMPFDQLYKQMVNYMESLKQNAGKDIAVQ